MIMRWRRTGGILTLGPDSREVTVGSLHSLCSVVVAIAGVVTARQTWGQVAEREQPGKPIIVGQTITIRSEILNEDRRINVRLPDRYEQHPDERYPVVYQLDGGAPGPFYYLTGLVDYLSEGAGRIPHMIVIGIPNTERTRDLSIPLTLTPPIFQKNPFTSDSIRVDVRNAGGADAFLRFLSEELFPEIERRYRAAPFRVLVGHSLGGLFVTHALLSRPEMFNAYVAASPALLWSDRAIFRAARRAVAAVPATPRFFYTGVGDSEAPELIASATGFRAVLQMAAPPTLRWWYQVMPGESHQSNPVPSYASGLTTIFQSWAIPEHHYFTGDIAGVEAHVAKAAQTYGFAFVPAEGVFQRMAGAQMARGSRDRAIALLKRSVELHSESATASDRLAGALEGAGRLPEALAQREETVRRAQSTHHPRLEAFTARRDTLRSKLATRP
jgi:hypothetical protein